MVVTQRYEGNDVFWEQNMTSISQIALDGAVGPYTEFWFPNCKHTPYSDMTHTLDRLEIITSLQEYLFVYCPK